MDRRPTAEYNNKVSPQQPSTTSGTTSASLATIQREFTVATDRIINLIEFRLLAV